MKPLSLSTQFFDFEADDGCLPDLGKIKEYMAWAKEEFSSIFPGIRIEKAMIVVYDQEKEIYPGAKVDCHTMRSDPPNKKIYLLCPSGCKNITEEYYRKNLLHEYAHLFTYKPKYSKWFSEGIVENIAIFHSNDQKIEKQYEDYVSGPLEQIFNKHFSCKNNMAYAWAVYLIKFMLDINKQGIERLLLEDEGRTFEDDLKNVYGSDLKRLPDMFWEWMRCTFSININDSLRQIPLFKEIDRYL